LIYASPLLHCKILQLFCNSVMYLHKGSLKECQWLHQSNVIRIVTQDPGQTGLPQLLQLFCNDKCELLLKWKYRHLVSSDIKYLCINPLNAELNPICHLLVLLGDLTFMGTCIVSIFQCISNKMQSYTVYLYLETALHVSGGTSTHHQERIQLYLQHLVFVTPLLLSAAVVEEFNMFRSPPCPSSGAYNCINSLWFYHWSVGGSSIVGCCLVG
jgi:hypothetical protein